MATLDWNTKTTSKKQNTNCIWDNWQALQFTFRHNAIAQPTQAWRNIKKKALHATPPEGKQTPNTHAQRDNTSVQELSSSFGRTGVKARSVGLWFLLVSLQHNDFFYKQRSIKESTKQEHVISQITKHLKQLGFLKMKHLIKKKRLCDVHPLFNLC